MTLRKMNLKKVVDNLSINNRKAISRICKKGEKYKILIESFTKTYKELAGVDYNFQEKRTTRDGKQLGSDAFRLIKIFEYLQAKTGKHEIACGMIIGIIEAWSRWDKAHPLNLIGFIENQCRDEEIGKFYMKAKNVTKEKKSLHNEDHRRGVVDKHRKLFDE
jgi:hypothetical protein